MACPAPPPRPRIAGPGGGARPRRAASGALPRLLRRVAACLLLAPVLPALEVEHQAWRGLEDHRARLVLGGSQAGTRDSLRLDLRVEWRAGFRDHNRDSRRLWEALDLDGTRRLEGPWRLRWTGRQTIFNERRSLRETLGSSLDLGLRRAGPLAAEALAGWMQDRRQTGYDHGPRWRLEAGASGREADLDWAGRGQWREERPGRRRNRRLEAGVSTHWQAAAETRNETRLTLRDQREDAFPDPRREDLERRRGRDLELRNRYRRQLGAPGELSVEFTAWNRGQDRRPRDAADSLAASRGSLLDRGLDLRLNLEQRRGRLTGGLAAVLLRQRQDAEYGPLDRTSRTLSAIARHRLDARLLWQPGGDSLSARVAAELRRRDTDFTGPVRRDPDDMDQGRRELRLRWSRAPAPGARWAVEGGLDLDLERHVQASRSRANYLNRTWRAATDHLLGLGAWRVAGGGSLVADYRLYDFEDPERPRSWIQRRLQLSERLRRPLGGGTDWRWAGEGNARWMEEDGGSFLKSDGRERISDSAREWQAGLVLEARRAAWTLRPGWDWSERRDPRWDASAGRRQAELARLLRRQGPLLSVARLTATGALRLQVRWEWVRDAGAAGPPDRRRNLWGRLDWSWHPR